MPHSLRKTEFGLPPLVKARLNGNLYLFQGAKVPVVRGQPARQLPDTLNGRKLRTVWRQEQQFEVRLLLFQARLEQLGMRIPGIVEHDYRFLLGIM